MRLIDADAIPVVSADPYEEAGFRSAIEDVPTIDAVTVVRCKDCKYGIDWDGRLGCEWHGFYQTEPNWFCADGERSEE